MIPAKALIVSAPEEFKAEAQERLSRSINKVQAEVAKQHPPCRYAKTAEEWWAIVDEYWAELLGLAAYNFNLQALADPDGRPAGTSLPVEHPEPLAVRLETMRRDRDLRLADFCSAIWMAAPDSGEIHARPAWNVLCDLCSESYVLYEDVPLPMVDIDPSLVTFVDDDVMAGAVKRIDAGEDVHTVVGEMMTGWDSKES